jgi:hypothetical protein
VVLRRIFRRKIGEGTGELRKLHSEELRNLFFHQMSDQTKEDGIGGACSMMRNAYKILVRESERKGHLGRRRRRWEDIIKMHLKI